MKKTLEKLNSTKFSKIESNVMSNIHGGLITGKGHFPSEYTNVYGKDGLIIGYNSVTLYWTSDESDGRDFCYYGEYKETTFIPI